jgi:hypothetical protein
MNVTMTAQATEEDVASAVTSRNTKENRGKRCCQAVRNRADSVTTMEHVIPRHPHQQRDCVFCWVRSEAISLDRPSQLVVGHSPAGKNVSREAEDTVAIRHQATTSEDTTG